MPLVKLRSQVLRKHQKESKDSGAMEIALQSTSFFSLLAFFLFQVSTIKAGIVETNLSIQIFNLACLRRMFASCIKKYWKRNQRKEQIISFFRCPCSIIQVDSNCATTSFVLALLALAHRSKSFVGKDAPSHKGYVKKRLLQCSVGSWHRKRLISEKVRLVYKPEAAQSAEKSRVQASCMVDIFRATDKAGQRGDESCLTGCFNSDAILKLAAEGIDPWFLRNRLH